MQISQQSFAQENDSMMVTDKVVAREFAAGIHYGSIFAHSEEVQNTAGANPFGIELGFIRQRRDKGAVDLCNCYPRQGLVFSYFDFDNEILGRAAMAGWLLEPVYPLGQKWQLAVRGIAGLTWMSNPYDSIKNPANQSYSTALSAWLVLGFSVSYPLSQNFRVQLGGNFEHTSNGGMLQPNKGVNYPTASLHFQYAPNPVAYYRGPRSEEKYWKGKPWRKDLAIWGTGKRSVNAAGVGTRQPIVGGLALASKQVGRINALTAGLEGYYDGYTDKRMDADSIAGTSAFRVSILGGHEFLLGKFIFSQQVGVYAYNPSPYDGSWFHRWGFLFKAGRPIWIGINLKAHRHVADFIDARMVYSW